MLSYEKKIFFLNFLQNTLSEVTGITENYYRLGYHLSVSILDDVMETFAFSLKYAKWYSSDSKWKSEMEDAKADANEIVEKLKNYLKGIGIEEVRIVKNVMDNDSNYAWIEITGYFNLNQNVKEAIIMLDTLRGKRNAA